MAQSNRSSTEEVLGVTREGGSKIKKARSWNKVKEKVKRKHRRSSLPQGVALRMRRKRLTKLSIRGQTRDRRKW